jgi:phage shock protein PspC (stress-responsive transcriptional regulator)
MNEDEKRQMEDSEQADESSEAPTRAEEPTATRERRLLRSRSDRMIFGVAGGLASYFHVDPLIFRIGFVLSIFFGGLGALAYLALALFVPAGDGAPESEAPVQRSRWLGVAAGVGLVLLLIPAVGWGFWGDGPWGLFWPALLILIGVGIYALLRDRERPLSGGRLVAVVALAIGVAIGVLVLGAASAWATAEGGGLIVAGVTGLIAVALIVAAFTGGARWLIVPALALAIPAAAVAAADITLEGGYGKRHYEPATTEAIPAEGYELAVGQLLIDLRELRWDEREVVDLDLDLGVGEAVIAVPDRVCVEADAHAGAGALEVGGDEIGGFDVDSDQGAGATATPRLSLNADVDAGVIRVVAGDDVDLDAEDHGPFGGRSDDEPASACAS